MPAEALAFTCLQAGQLNTPLEQAVRNGESQLIALHDVVALVRTLLSLSAASQARERLRAAIADEPPDYLNEISRCPIFPSI